MNKPEVIIVHHTGGTDTNPLLDTSHHTARTIKAGHLANGWNDIGYHYVIEKDGKTVAGRDEKVIGAHTVGMNDKSIGICLSGNFDATLPTQEQLNAFVALYKALYAKYPHITPDKIYPHRKYAKKTCYGKKLSDTFFSELVQKVSQKPQENPEVICKQFLEKQNTNFLVDFLQYLFSIIRKSNRQ